MEITINVTTPSDMSSNLSKLSEAVEKFERCWKLEDKDEGYYHLVIDGEYNREVCNEIQKIYTNAGWKKVDCKTSSENGERYGLTGLVLWK